jgi:FkbM family methyltransferase
MIQNWQDVRLHLVYQFLKAQGMSKVHTVPDLVKLGYGQFGWWLPEKVLKPGAVAYCAGAGLDISFDLDLLARGCLVRTLDPTPLAVEYVEGLQISDSNFQFLKVGVWNSDTELKFYQPKPRKLGENHTVVNHSVVNLQKTDEYFEAPVRTLRSIMRDIGDDHVDILKIDIEGAEYTVIDELLSSGPQPQVLLVEFDQPQPVKRTIRAVNQLLDAGYSLAKIDWFNYTFVKQPD